MTHKPAILVNVNDFTKINVNIAVDTVSVAGH